jgi:hypothetical protein
VIGEHVQAAQVHGQAAVLGDRDEDRPLALRVLPHGPLALIALAARAAEQWQDLDPGLFVHLFDVAAQFTLSATWTPAVGGLAEPPPSLGQHLRSWLPGSSFVVLLHPSPAVVKTSALPRTLGWAGAVEATRTELMVAGELPPSALDRVSKLAGTTTVRPVEPIGPTHARFGSARAVEMCALPDRVEELVGPISEARCPSCLMLSPSWLCAFCKRSTAPVVIGGGE